MPVLRPDPASPALKTFGAAVVAKALRTARLLAYGSVGDQTLLTAKKHTLGDFSAETRYLTPAGLKRFTQALDAYLNGGDSTNVVGLALFFVPGSPNHPDIPLRIKEQTYRPNLTVGVDGLSSNRPRMLISGTMFTRFAASSLSGRHGTLSFGRGFTYAMVPTGNPANPVGLDAWRSSFKFGQLR